MSKELTPLEALKHFRNQLQGVNVYADEYLDIIEQALKDYERLKNVKPRRMRLIQRGAKKYE